MVPVDDKVTGIANNSLLPTFKNKREMLILKA